MDNIKKQFAKCKAEHRPAFVTYFMAGCPTPDSAVDILLGLQRGHADIIELGLPHSDPIADGVAVTQAGLTALANGVTIDSVFEIVKEARQRGLRIPVLAMGYYNPILRYGEEKFLVGSKEAGIDGFIIVDLPPEEAVRLRRHCTKLGLSYIPLISPATSDARMQLLCKIADSFIYVVSRMSVTGQSLGTLNADLPNLLERVHKYSGGIPSAVGFGVQTREHYLSIAKIAEGVVIGSQIIREISQAAPGEEGAAVEKYCRMITGNDQNGVAQTREVGIVESMAEAKEPNGSLAQADEVITTKHVNGDKNDLLDQLETALDGEQSGAIPMRFGEFGGQYVPEALVDCLAELDKGFRSALADPSFWEEYRSYYPYMGRPSPLQFADRLTEHVGGAKIYLKREDLLHTGSHKINNAIGQILLARRLGKTEIIAETGAGQHGVATATVCAKFGMKCTVYMGAEDVRRQALNVFRMKLLGAKVVAVDAGSRTLRDAVNECLRYWVTSLSTTHYIIGSAIGPHPFPTIVRTFQSVIGNETREQIQKQCGKLPDAVVACVGGGSNAAGMFAPFVNDASVKLVGVEAGGDGLDSMKHAATLSGGTKGVLHGVKTYILQNEHGQISDTHSISAGLDYPGVGPELASWKDSHRARYMVATDAEALQGFKTLGELEGLLPALETAHAVWGAMELAKTMSQDQYLVICLSGRGDKDVQTIADELPKFGPQIGWDLRF